MSRALACLTMTRGDHDHLLGQVDGLSVGTAPPTLHVAVSMGDRDLTRGRLPLGTDRWETVVKPVPTDHRAVPLAAARNAAAREAIDRGADVLVFLAGSVIPGPRTLERLADAVTGGGTMERPDLPAGPVVWMPPVLNLPQAQNPTLGYPMGRLAEVALRTPGTPRLRAGELRVESDPLRFSGTAFAMSAADFDRSGGFAPDYTGHGLEDSDFATSVLRREGALVWVGGADAYEQPTEPVARELEERIAVRHARAWRQRWGTPSDHPWLTRLVAEGRLRRGRDGEYRPLDA